MVYNTQDYWVFGLCPSEIIQNQENGYVHGIGQGEARHRKYKKLELGGVQT
jgi:hypothetical protein